MYFWCHVGLSAEFGLQSATSVTAQDGSSESEVSDLQVEYSVVQNVFRFKVSVSDPLLMDIV